MGDNIWPVKIKRYVFEENEDFAKYVGPQLLKEILKLVEATLVRMVLPGTKLTVAATNQIMPKQLQHSIVLKSHLHLRLVEQVLMQVHMDFAVENWELLVLLSPLLFAQNLYLSTFDF